MAGSKIIDCRKCKFYEVTWDRQRPHGCRGFGFKSHRLPSLVVRRATPGKECLLYERSPKVKP